LTLAALAGHGERPTARASTGGKSASSGRAATKVMESRPKQAVTSHPAKGGEAGESGKLHDGREVGLTVRVEVNLPPSGDAATYDAIFASIKKHFMS
jgi:hypothetical protein